jgi:hypothetical protein
MKKILITAIIFLSATITSFAQENYTLYNMPWIPQAQYENPGRMPNYNGHLSLPAISSIYANFNNSGFKYSDLIKRRSDDSLVVSIDNMINQLQPDNNLQMNIHSDALSFGFRIKRNYFSFTASGKLDLQFNYPKDLMVLLQNGNAAFIGKEAQVNMKLNGTAYMEYGFGFTHITKNEKLSYGARVKLLSGIANVQTEKANLSIYTDESDYSIKATSDVLINTSGLDTNTNMNLGNNIFGNNKGWAFDLGATYQLSKKWSISASILDLGSIQWNDSTHNYKTKNPGTTFNFKGFDLKEFFKNGNGIDSSFTNLSDSLSNTFDLVKTYNKYRSNLTTKVYLGATYKINNTFTAGILWYGQFGNNQLNQTISTSINATLGKWFSSSLSYSLINMKNSSIGLGLMLRPFSGFQIYIVSDNAMALLNPENARNFNLRMGINFVMGNRLAVKSASKAKEKSKPAVI